MSTPAFHYGLFVAIFAIVGLILVVVVGILKEHRFLRFRTRRAMIQASGEKGKTSREALHSLLGPSKLGFSRLRTYDSDSEAEEFPIFSRVRSLSPYLSFRSLPAPAIFMLINTLLFSLYSSCDLVKTGYIIADSSNPEIHVINFFHNHCLKFVPIAL